MATYRINEVFVSVQGEGIDTGKLSTFVRFAGCNLACPFCDTNFAEHYQMDAQSIVNLVQSSNVVLTGGEPLLQDIRPLVDALWKRGCIVTVETNGTIPLDLNQVDRISLSPKIPFEKCRIHKTTSLKILFPYLHGVTAQSYIKCHARYRSLQVIDADKYPGRILDAVEELKHLPPQWRLGLQIHKLIGVK